MWKRCVTRCIFTAKLLCSACRRFNCPKAHFKRQMLTYVDDTVVMSCSSQGEEYRKMIVLSKNSFLLLQVMMSPMVSDESSSPGQFAKLGAALASFFLFLCFRELRDGTWAIRCVTKSAAELGNVVVSPVPAGNINRIFGGGAHWLRLFRGQR